MLFSRNAITFILRYQELIGQAKKLPEVKAKLDENKKFFEYLKNNSGLNITLETAVLLYSNIHTQVLIKCT